MNTPPTAKEYLYQIQPYKPGEGTLPGFDKVIKLASNEGPFGPSPKVVEAVSRAASRMHRYPETTIGLRQALGEKYGIEAEQIVCAPGSDELITLFSQAYAGEGDEVLFPQYAFLKYRLAAMGFGATPVTAPETADLVADPQAIVDRITPRTKLVFLANPNNPTGTCLGRDAVRYIAENTPEHAMFVLDSAYAEYMDADADYSDGIAEVRDFPNVAMLRTFSKIHALGGLRLGWCYAHPEVIGVLNRIRNSFNVSTLAIAGGIAALGDDEFMRRSLDHNREWRQWTTQALTELGYKVYESAGNFVLVDFGSPEKAQEIDRHLRAHGYIVRPVAAYGLPSCLRVSIGLAEEMTGLMDVLKKK